MPITCWARLLVLIVDSLNPRRHPSELFCCVATLPPLASALDFFFRWAFALPPSSSLESSRKGCCKAGSPQAAVDALGEAGKYGLDGEGVVSSHRFNYLLSQLYKAGDSDGECVAVGCTDTFARLP